MLMKKSLLTTLSLLAVLLGASDNTGGHDDGYFALSVLNTNENYPIGARESTAGYSMGQGAVIN